MLVFLFILLFVIFIIIGIIFSKVEVDIKINYDNFEKDEIRSKEKSKEKNERKNIEKNLKYKIKINTYLYKIRYLRLFKIDIDNNYISLYKNKISLKKFSNFLKNRIIKKIGKNFNIEKEIKSFKIRYLNLLKINIKKFLFNSKIYSESNMFTIHFMTFLYTFIFNIIGYLSFKNNVNKIENVYVNIIPLFEDQSINNLFFYQNKKLIKSNINVNMILDISTVSVIKFIYNMNKNKKE